MAGELGLPSLEGTVTFYPNRFLFESALSAESFNDLDQVEKQFGAKVRQEFEQNIAASAAQTAVSASAVGKYRKVLINEWYFYRSTWLDNMRVLTHELTHTAQRELIHGRIPTYHTWMGEGFAEWIAYKVLDRLSAQTFAKAREHSVDSIYKAKVFQTFPGLSQLKSPTEWRSWMRTLGLEATYGQAMLAVDFLIEKKNLAAVIEYFGLFDAQSDAEKNFARAFGESTEVFEKNFDRRLVELLGK